MINKMEYFKVVSDNPDMVRELLEAWLVTEKDGVALTESEYAIRSKGSTDSLLKEIIRIPELSKEDLKFLRKNLSIDLLSEDIVLLDKDGKPRNFEYIVSQMDRVRRARAVARLNQDC